MRLSKREVTDFDEIVSIIDACDILHLGIPDTLPYVVPVSFGYTIESNQIVIYFHGAKAGRKYELLQSEPEISIVFDSFQGYKQEHYGYTAKYESVMASGKVCMVLEDSEKLFGLNCIVKHGGFPEFKQEDCLNFNHTATYKIVLENITAKRRT